MRRQCSKCPWKVTTDPFDIPNGYDVDKHKALDRTIADPGSLRGLMGGMHIMACHETEKQPCVGWLVHQLGPGNNIPLRMAVMTGRVDGDVEVVGLQHQCLEDTLSPKK